jgi:RpiR family transcriptional regulator, carbohydrate utilization regulator
VTRAAASGGHDASPLATGGGDDPGDMLDAGGSDILSALVRHLPGFSRTETRLAEAVLRSPEAAAHMTLAAFAQAADVSQPTAIRFCRKMGCAGFPDFRIAIAQAAARGALYVHREIRADDPLSSVVSKVFASSVDTLQMVAQRLDLGVIGRAVGLIAAARRIELLGTGLSSVAAIDAHQKFMRLGVPTGLHGDGHLQRMSCATLVPGDVAVAFSYTGQLRDFLRTCETVIERGAALVAVTRSQSPLARIATETIAIDTLENTFVYAPMTTRLAHLAVVDVLATAVALEGGSGRVATIRRVKRALRDEWLVDPDPDAGDGTAPGAPRPTPETGRET